MSSPNRAVPRITEAIFTCSHCRHPLEQTWSEVDGLTFDGGEGAKPYKEPHVHCPNCGRKLWFPPQYRRR